MAELTWGAPLFFDLWAAGMAGGAYFAAFLLGLFGADRDQRLLKLSTYLAVPLVLIGVVLIIADLGEPLRAFNMYLGTHVQAWQVIGGTGVNSLRGWPPSLTFFLVSPMSLGGWALVLFSIFGVLLIVFFLAQAAKAWELDGAVGWGVDLLRALAPVVQILAWITFGVAILVMTYTGVVLAASAMELWSATFLLPALFVASAIGTGAAALILVARLAGAGGDARLMGVLRQAFMVLLAVQLVILAGFVLWASAAGAAGSLLTGTIGLVFWIGVVLLGLVAPLVLGYATARAKRATAFLFSPALVMLGGLLLRATIIVAGQM